MFDTLHAFLSWTVWQSMVLALVLCGGAELDEQAGQGEALAVMVIDPEQGACGLWQ